MIELTYYEIAFLFVFAIAIIYILDRAIPKPKMRVSGQSIRDALLREQKERLESYGPHYKRKEKGQ